MKLTKEEILKKYNMYKGFRSTYSWDEILKAMEEYSNQEVMYHHLNTYSNIDDFDCCEFPIIEEAAKKATEIYINEREKQTVYLSFIEGAKWLFNTIKK